MSHPGLTFQCAIVELIVDLLNLSYIPLWQLHHEA